MKERFSSFSEFWPYYLGEHRNRLCRALHYAGSMSALSCLAAFAVTLNPVFLLAGLISGYGPAWVGHFFVEHNRPATFTYPLWSLAADYRMLWCFLRGRIVGEMARWAAQGFRVGGAADQAQGQAQELPPEPGAVA